MQEQNYSVQWKDLRIRMIAFWVNCFGGFLTFPIISHFIHGAGNFLGPLWLIAFFILGGRWSSFLCPRCGNKFFKPNAWSVNQFINKCPHCGLEKWTNYS